MPGKLKSFNGSFTEWSIKTNRRDYKIHREFNDFYKASYGEYQGDKTLMWGDIENVQFKEHGLNIWKFKKVRNV